MRYIIGFCFLFLGVVGFGQVERTAGIAIGTTVPTHTPSTQGALKYYNRSSGVSYRWTGSAWTVETVDLSGYLQWSDTATLATKHYVDSQGFLTAEVDGSITNEIQDLSISGTTLSLSGDASPVDLSGIGLISSGVAGYLPQYLSATTQDTTGLFWNATTGVLGIGTASPSINGRLTIPGNLIFSGNGLARGILQATSDGSDNGWVFFCGGGGTLNSENRGGNFTAYGNERVNYAGALILQAGNVSSTGTFDGDIVFDTKNAIRARLDQDGNFGLGVTAATGTRLNIMGTGTNSSTTALLVENSAGTDALKINDAGIVTIGSAANTASSVLDVQSTTLGFLPPRMTTAQRDAISSPATGLMLFCTDCTATDGSTGVSQTYSSGTWRNHY